MKKYLLEVDEVTWSTEDGDFRASSVSERNGEGLWSDWFDSLNDAVTAFHTRGGFDEPEIHETRYGCGTLTFQTCEVWEHEFDEDGSIDDEHEPEQVEAFDSLTDLHRKAWDIASKSHGKWLDYSDGGMGYWTVKDAYEALLEDEEKGE